MEAKSRLNKHEKFYTFQEVEQWVKQLADECFYPIKINDSITIEAYNRKVA